MDFEWDAAKSATNLSRRGFGFAYAAAIFLGPTLEAVDGRRDYGEMRTRAIGAVDDEVLVVIYTDRGDARRIISARRANRMERLKWQSFASR